MLLRARPRGFEGDFSCPGTGLPGSLLLARCRRDAPDGRSMAVRPYRLPGDEPGLAASTIEGRDQAGGQSGPCRSRGTSRWPRPDTTTRPRLPSPPSVPAPYPYWNAPQKAALKIPIPSPQTAGSRAHRTPAWARPLGDA